MAATDFIAPDFIPPEVRARLRDLRLSARGHAGADGLGQHASRSRGAGLEFAQYRAYEPGDEPRRIDWKLYARSDRYFVREAERDSPLTVWLIVDATASMRQADSARPDFNKLDAAKSIAACVIELALRQGDRFGLISAGGHRPPSALGGAAPMPVPVPAGAGPRQRDRCLLELARIAPAGDWPDAAALRPLWERIAANALVVILSDFFDEATVELAERLAAARREVLTVQMLAADERDFPFSGGHRFRDPESAAERRVEASAVRKDFLERFTAARVQLAQRFAARGIRHAEYVLDEAPDAPLRQLLGSGSNPSPSGRGAGVKIRAEPGAHAEYVRDDATAAPLRQMFGSGSNPSPVGRGVGERVRAEDDGAVRAEPSGAGFAGQPYPRAAAASPKGDGQ